jgi:arsenate reductase
MITIYHNPRCSKSREAHSMVEQFANTNGIALNVVDYQKNPLTLQQLAEVQQLLGENVRAMVRDNEEEYAALNLAQADDKTLLNALAAHPKLLQRPIVVYGNKAMIGRPPERLQALLKTATGNA